MKASQEKFKTIPNLKQYGVEVTIIGFVQVENLEKVLLYLRSY